MKGISDTAAGGIWSKGRRKKKQSGRIDKESSARRLHYWQCRLKCVRRECLSDAHTGDAGSPSPGVDSAIRLLSFLLSIAMGVGRKLPPPPEEAARKVEAIAGTGHCEDEDKRQSKKGIEQLWRHTQLATTAFPYFSATLLTFLSTAKTCGCRGEGDNDDLKTMNSLSFHSMQRWMSVRGL